MWGAACAHVVLGMHFKKATRRAVGDYLCEVLVFEAGASQASDRMRRKAETVDR
jgi:hypothetical protein